ncbi:branched-chain amino acid ABC transporter permease LivH [Aquamicrobium lusatiense]|jgi:branched-chain amino acid transport system permease protein|uniref:Branched-chain amino acid transport system permease protein n=1 Tax=Aquamicrobium lusatiense TaxID=89772 RepID=A0A7W9S2Y2_9HYPH|nr:MULTISPECIES: branched-chain amino acid ABC transporter permease LivH [Aquamicrobium]MBB6011938.1 branched-chain amino acid transport system permease protein [Aquamicrobium lusatiense]MCK9550898.1 branched-chain amino acid ABC transporter permease LivH [Aquamicrobium sp.]MDH4992492.1 branched-chain amino acid ABC transporter permease LivH [Aquamicrobium lusatiense]
MEYFAQQVLNGLTIGSVYGLIAVGYTMVYGIVGMINFAHGEIYMIGAFVGVIVLTVLGSLGITFVPLLIAVALIASIVITSVYGYTLEKVAYRPLRGSTRLAALISAIGMSIFLQNFVLLVQGARVKSVPQLITERHVLYDGGPGAMVTVTNSQLLIMGVAAVVMLAFGFLVAKTPLGRSQRACAQDKVMAAYLGVQVDRTIATTFVLGAALAAVAGVLVSLYYGVVDFFVGFVAGIKAFTAAVLGGIGSIKGAFLGGIILGLVEALWSSYLSFAYKDVAAFSLLILILLVRPTGLIGRPETEKV